MQRQLPYNDLQPRVLEHTDNVSFEQSQAAESLRPWPYMYTDVHLCTVRRDVTVSSVWSLCQKIADLTLVRRSIM